jgi:uncharacterized protein YyaL (SSP411 family)
MLYDNAQLARLYLHAAAAFREPRYRAVALDTLDFLIRDLRAPEGGFGASFDADTEGEEGATYVFTPTELVAVAGTDADALGRLLGVTPAGNFEGSNVLTRRGAEGDVANDELWATWRPRLLEARSRRRQPHFDPKRVTAWNGLAIGALAVGYRASGERRFLDAARDALDAVWKYNHRPSGELTRASNGTRSGDLAILDDHAFLAAGVLDLFEATGEPLLLQRSLDLARVAMARFANPSGGWFSTASPEQEPLGRRMDLSDGVEPSGNAAMILLLLRLASLTGQEPLRAAARRAIRAYARTSRQAGLEMAGWLEGALLAEGPFYELVIAGEGRGLHDAWAALLPSWTVTARVPAPGASDALAELAPPVAGKGTSGSASRAFVCVRGSCKLPTPEARVLERQLREGWRY